MRAFTYQVRNAEGENVRLDTLNEDQAWEPKEKGETAEVIDVQELEPTALERVAALIEELKSKAETERQRILGQDGIGRIMLKKTRGGTLAGGESDLIKAAEKALDAVDKELAGLLKRLEAAADPTAINLPAWAQG